MTNTYLEENPAAEDLAEVIELVRETADTVTELRRIIDKQGAEIMVLQAFTAGKESTMSGADRWRRAVGQGQSPPHRLVHSGTHTEHHEQPSSISLRYGKGPGAELKLYFHDVDEGVKKLNDARDMIALAQEISEGVQANGNGE